MLGPAITTVPVSGFSPGSSFTLSSFRCAGANYNGNDLLAVDVTPTELILDTRGMAGNSAAAVQLVDIPGAVVTRGSLEFANADVVKTAPIASTCVACGWLTYSYNTGDPNGQIGRALIAGGADPNRTTVTFTRDVGGAPARVSWQWVELPGAHVSHGSVTLPADALTQSVPLTLTDATRAFASGGYQGTAGRSPHAGDGNIGVGFATFEIVSATELKVTRSRAVAEATFEWWVVEFP